MKLKRKIKIPLDEFINFSLYDKKKGYYMKKNPFGKKEIYNSTKHIKIILRNDCDMVD